MTSELVSTLAGWAWRTSLEALPLAFAVFLLARWRGVSAAWKWGLPALFFLRLAMPQVPEVGWHWWRVSSPAAALPPAAELQVATGMDASLGSSFDLLAIVWLLGCGVVLGWVAVSHWRLSRWISRTGVPADETIEQHAKWACARLRLKQPVPLLVVPGFPTLAVRGWLRPIVLIPQGLAEQFTSSQIRGMLLHEMAHIRRRDVLWTWLALGVCAVHWFNPLAWLALRRFHADRELACDAAALRALDSSARRDYGEALLRCLQGQPLHAAPALAAFFRRFPELKQRLQNIMQPTSPTLRNRLLIALLVPTLAAVTFTTARAQRDGDAAKPAAPEAAPEERPLRDGEKPKTEKRDGEARREKARDGEREKAATRDGEKSREGARDGERKRNGARDGEGPRKAGPRDGDQPKSGARDGDQPRTGARDGDPAKAGLRDGDVKKSGARDGDQPRKGPRDGEGVKAGARDGDAPKTAPREGDAKPQGEKPEAR